MGRLEKLKLAAHAMRPDAIRQGLAASREALSGMPGATGPRLTDEQLAALPPDARARYEEAMAATAVSRQQMERDAAARVEEERSRRALGGAAGQYVYGDLPPDTLAGMTVEASLAQTKAELRDVLRNPLGRHRAPAAPMAPDPDAGPVDRDAQAAAERAARDAARAPYLAPDRAAVRISRLATQAGTQLQEVAAYLGTSGLAGRPDLVYGVSRVPDHIGGGLTRAKSRIVEWDVVHAATSELPPAPAPTTAGFDARERWVARRPGEPSVLDEELALAYLARAGIGPERCLGIVRLLDIRGHGGGEESSASVTVTQVTGVHALHPADGAAERALAALRAERPLAGCGPVDGVHLEVLNWGAVARAVHPQTHRRPTIPSPFPHLPSTPQELLRAHLEIVGVQPADCFGAQITEDRPRDLTGVSRKGLLTVSTNRGEEQPCADGRSRPRLTGGSRVVVAYRDAPAYAAGRERWAAYEREVLESALANGTGVRRPVEDRDIVDKLPKTLRRMVRTAEAVGEFIDGDGDDPFGDIPPHRYCWPPQT